MMGILIPLVRWNQRGTGGPWHAVSKAAPGTTVCKRRWPRGFTSSDEVQIDNSGEESAIGCKQCLRGLGLRHV